MRGCEGSAPPIAAVRAAVRLSTYRHNDRVTQRGEGVRGEGVRG